MTRRTGSTDLPLHGGRVPRDSHRGARSSRKPSCGHANSSKGLAHPFWFQPFGPVMGMDWHLSGTTTERRAETWAGALQDELRLYVCGGRGKHNPQEPDELKALGNRTAIDVDRLTRASPLVAKRLRAGTLCRIWSCGTVTNLPGLHGLSLSAFAR